MKEYYFSFPEQLDFSMLKNLIHQCENEVIFESTEGDRIALKSALGQFIFFSMSCELDFLHTNACLHCTGEHDRALLSQVLTLR